MDILAWDWASIGKIFLSAGFGSAFGQAALTIYRDRVSKSDRAAYLALRLAIQLESYCYDCATFVSENYNAYTPPGEQLPSWSVQLPMLAPYPDEPEAWRSLDRKLAARSLNLPNAIAQSQMIIRGTVDDGPDDDLIETLDLQAADRGGDAWDLATALRKQYAIEPIEPMWDAIGWLKQRKASALAAQERRAAQHAALSARLPKFGPGATPS